MTYDIRRLSTRRVIVSSVFVITLLALLFLVWVNITIEHNWVRMQRRVDVLTTEGRTFTLRRPGALQPVEEGDSWKEYGAALRDSKPQLQQRNSDLYAQLVRLDVGVDPIRDWDVIASILDDCVPHFARLCRGGHRGEVSIPFQWDHLDLAGFSDTSDYGWASPLASAAVLQARRLVESGKIDAGIELLLATAQFGHDLGEAGVGFTLTSANYILSLTMKELRRLLTSGGLDQQQLRRLDVALEALDRDVLKEGRSLRNGVLAVGQLFLRGETLESGRTGADRMIRPSMRDAYSLRALKTDAFFRADEWCTRLASVSQRNYDEEYLIRCQIRDEAEGSRNGFAFVLRDCLLQWSAQRDWVVRLRLLRVGVRWLFKGEILEAADPFGALLSHQCNGATLKASSIGKEKRSARELYSLRDLDYSLEVKR